MSTRDNGTGQDQIDWLADLISRHVGVQPFEGQLFCPCGFRLYHPTTGFGAGPVKQRPGQSIGEAAHADHLARVIAKGWLTTGTASHLPSTPELGDTPDEFT